MRARFVLAAILGLGLALRVWGIAFGLPHIQARPDELLLVSLAMDFLHGQFWPPFYDYPRLVPYVFAGSYALYAVSGIAAGWFQSFADFLATWKQWWPPLFLVGRIVSAICGTLTIAITYQLAADSFGRRVALVGSFFVAVSYLAVRESHYATTDAVMTLLCWTALALLARAQQNGRRRTLWAATLFAALALSSKYSAAPIALAVGAAIVLLWRDGRFSPREAFLQFVLLAIGGAVVFLALNPYVIFDWDRFHAALRMLAASYRTGMKTAVALPPGWAYHLLVSLRFGVGWPILVAGPAGLALAVWRRPSMAVVIGAFAIGFYVAIASSNLLFARYALPLVPVLCIGAAVAIDALVRPLPARTGIMATAILAVALAIPSIVSVVQLDQLLAREDSRSLATVWIEANVPAGARIAQSGSEYGRVQLPWGHGYRLWSFHPRFNGLVEGRWDPVMGEPDYIIVQESPLPYSYVVLPMQQMLNERYELVHAIRAMKMDRQGENVYDQQDAFFLPYAGFAGVVRPGPNLYIWQRRNPR